MRTAQEAPQMGRDWISVANHSCGAVARAARREAARAGNEGEAEATTGPQRPENSAEPGPERPATKWQERKNGSTSVVTTGHRSGRPLVRGLHARPVRMIIAGDPHLWPRAHCGRAQGQGCSTRTDAYRYQPLLPTYKV